MLLNGSFNLNYILYKQYIVNEEIRNYNPCKRLAVRSKVGLYVYVDSFKKIESIEVNVIFSSIFSTCRFITLVPTSDKSI